jgi:hypothetical protein
MGQGMKKNPDRKPLRLDTSTVRALATAQLDRVLGGIGHPTSLCAPSLCGPGC